MGTVQGRGLQARALDTFDFDLYDPSRSYYTISNFIRLYEQPKPRCCHATIDSLERDAHGLTTSYSYNNRDRLLSKATPEGALSYTYDATSNALTLRSSNTNGASVDYSYDALNQLSTATGNASGARPATGTTTYSYDAGGNLSGYVYPNAVETTYQYNTLNRLTSMSLSKTTTNLASFTYTLGAAGNRTSVTELTGRKADYTYDDLYRLKSETITSDPVTANNGAINYTYDAVGNRLNRTSTIPAIPTTTSAFNPNDQLGSDAYDSNGNTTTSAGKTYVYDFENRIKSVNSGQIVFVYDGDGNRVAKTVGGVTTRFLVDANSPTGYAQVVEEIVGSNVQRVYEHGHSLISQTQLISSNWTTCFYGYDSHGSVRALTDTTGAMIDTYTYDAFGNLIASTGTTLNKYLYAGEQFDSDLGLYYLRARYMNQSSGRFWTMDQFEGLRYDPASIHKYLYVAADPVNKLDPSGLETLVTTLGSLNIYTTIQALAVAAVGTCALTLIASEIARSQGVDVESIPGPGSICVRKDDPYGDVTVYRGLSGTNPGEFKRALEDPDGLSTYEVLYPANFKFFLPFRVRYKKPKNPHVVGTVLNSPILGAMATYTPEFGIPSIGLYHWSLSFPGTLDQITKALSEFAKANKQLPF